MSIIFIILINVKIPTIVGILTFISRITTTFENLKQEISLFTVKKVKSFCCFISFQNQPDIEYKKKISD